MNIPKFEDSFKTTENIYYPQSIIENHNSKFYKNFDISMEKGLAKREKKSNKNFRKWPTISWKII